MQNKFSRKKYEAVLNESANEAKEFWNSEKGKRLIEKRKLTPCPLVPALSEFIKKLKDFENKTGKSLPAYFKGIRDEQEKECEKILNSMDAYAQKTGLIKPMDKDELTGFYLWYAAKYDLENKLPDRAIYKEFHNYIVEKIVNNNENNSNMMFKTLSDCGKCESEFITDEKDLCTNCPIKPFVTTQKDDLIVKFNTLKEVEGAETLSSYLDGKITECRKKIEDQFNFESREKQNPQTKFRPNRISVVLSFKECIKFYSEQLELLNKEINQSSTNGTNSGKTIPFSPQQPETKSEQEKESLNSNKEIYINDLGRKNLIENIKAKFILTEQPLFEQLIEGKKINCKIQFKGKAIDFSRVFSPMLKENNITTPNLDTINWIVKNFYWTEKDKPKDFNASTLLKHFDSQVL
jgi:hypothetical protein